MNLGLSPQQVRAMSLWDFAACIEGWRLAHDPKAKQELTDAEADELAALIDAG